MRKPSVGVALSAALLFSISAFGQLSPCAAPGPIAFIPLGSSNQVAVISLLTNALIGVCGNIVLTPARQGSGPVQVAASPFGAGAYATNADSAASNTDPFAVVSPLLGGQIPIGTGQYAAAFSPTIPTMLYVTNVGADVIETIGGTQTTVPGYAITVIDTTMVLPNAPLAQFAVVGAIPTDIAPVGIAIPSDGASMYVTHSGSNNVRHLGLPMGALIASINVGNRTAGIAATPLFAAAIGIVPSAYVTLPAANAVAVISMATDTVIGMIPVGRNPVAIAMNAAGTFAYVANNADGTISVIGTATGTVVANIPLTANLTNANNPISVAFDPATGQVVVLNAGTKTVSIINAATMGVAATIPVPLNCKDSFTPGCPAPLIRSSSAEGGPRGGIAPLSGSLGAGGGGGIGIGRSGDGGAEPLLYYSKLDGSTGAFGLYTGAAKPSLAASLLRMPPPFTTEREIAYDPFNKLLWYAAYDGHSDHIFAVDPVTALQANVDIIGFPGTPAQWDRHIFIDYAGRRLITPNADGSVSMYDLITHALSATIPASFFRGSNPGILRHFASDSRTGLAWYAVSDGSLVEIKLMPNVVETGRVIPFASQIGGSQDFRRHFVIDPKRNQLIYELNAGGNYALASIRLDTLKAADYIMTPDVFRGAAAEPYLTITLVNAPQCQLTVSAQPSSAGSIMISPEGNPGGYFDCGSTVTVRALPNSGFQFGSFSGDLSGSVNPQTLVVDRTRSVSASFNPAPAVSVTVSPATVTLTGGQTKQFTASVSNTWNTTVTWSLDSGPGSLDANGLYTAPNPIVPGPAIVRATSTADPHQSGTASVQSGVNVTLQTSPANLRISLDGGAFVAAPLTTALVIGSPHTIAAQSPQTGTAGTQYVWQNWSDGLPISHSISVPGADTVFTATFTGPATNPVITGVVNDASFSAGGAISTGSWVAIFGTNLAPQGDSRKWNEATEIINGILPTRLDGTSVTVNGKPAVVEFIQPTQVNIQPPDDAAIGPVQVVVTTPVGVSNSFTVNYAQFAPGLFPATAPYIVAQHADNSYVTAATPAKPGEVIVLWGTGFGPATPAVPAGLVFAGVSQLANTVTVTIGGQPAFVAFAGVVLTGLDQINVQVPTNLNNGDAAVVAAVGMVSTQTTANMISIHN